MDDQDTKKLVDNESKNTNENIFLWPLDFVTQQVLRRWLDQEGISSVDLSTYVQGPATNTANYVPQWNGANSKLLKDGLAVGTAANNLVQLNSSAELPAVSGANLTNLPVPSSFNNTFTAGETLALGDPVRLSVADTTIYSQTTTGTTNNISNTLAYAGYATKLTIGSQGARVTSIVLKLQKVGSPIDSVRVQILPDNAGNPDVGTNYQTVDKVGSSLSTSAQDETFIFDTFLNEGTYWIAVRRTGSSDGTNYYQVTAKSAVADSNSRYDNNSSTWYTVNAVPPYVIVYGTDTGTTGTLLKANGLTFPQSRLIGLTKAAITSGDSGLVVTQGYISGLSGLTTGYQYYLSDTGTLATSPGTRTIYVGKAISSTELLVNIYE